MKTIVVDANTFIAAGWRTNSQARRVFAAVARRRFRIAVTSVILEEYRQVSSRPKFAGKNFQGLFAWIEKYSITVAPMPLGKQRSRDPSDDIFIGCARGANASAIVSSDADLLDLGKPFGIEIMTPAIFIGRHKL